MRPLTAKEEATLRTIAARHGYLAERGPHAREGSASRLLDAVLSGELVTIALTPGERRKLLDWLESVPSPAPAGSAGVVRALAAQLRATLSPAATDGAAAGSPGKKVPAMAHRRLTSEEAAHALGLSVGRVQELARQRLIGRKDAGRWTFSKSEIGRYQDERLWEMKARALQPKRRRRHTARRAESRLTRDDYEAVALLDQILAQEREIEHAYSLPFRAPQRTEYSTHTCTRCGQPLLLLIFGDQAHDAEGLAAYGRLLQDEIVRHDLPAYVLGAARGDPLRDETPSLLRQVWPVLGEVRTVTPGRLEEFLEERSNAHCGGLSRSP